MSYQHHVFVSYSHENRWTPWTRDYFKPELSAHLQQELREKPDIFVDDRIHFGADYVTALAENLAHSRAMVAIFSGDYFSRQWCVHELDLMLDRAGGAPGLVIPVVVHDCDSLPSPVSRIQFADLKRFRVATMNVHGQKYEDFSTAVGTIAPDVCRTVRTAPAFDASWTNACLTRLTKVYEAEQRGGTIPPKWFKPPPPLELLTVPRLIL
jgi:hypothetical protein